MSLMKYLYEWFIKNNHKKYHKYFEWWYNNLSKEQVDYYTKEMSGSPL